MQNYQDSALSDRELEILRLVATGASNKEIAQALYISSNTVKVHLQNIFRKIGVVSRTEAALYAVHTGLVQTDKATAVIPASEGITVDPANEDSTDAPVLLQENDQSLASLSSQAIIPPRRRLWIAAWIGLLIIGLAGVYFLARNVFKDQPSALIPTAVSTPRWKELPSLPTARMGLAATIFENTIFTIGGETRQGLSPAVEQYDPQANAWTTLPAKPTPVTDISAVILGGKIYVPGGKLSDGTPSDAFEIYDPHLQQWEAGPRLPVPLSGYGLAVSEGRVFLFGGWDGKSYRSSVYEFNAAANIWSERTPMPTARAFCGAVVAGGDIYVIGGYDGKQALATNEVYKPALDNGTASPWSQAPSLPQARFSMGTASIADIILVVGGRTGSSQSKGSLPPLQYRLEIKSWQQLENIFPASWDRLSLVGLGSQLYGFGGEINGEPSGQAMSYQVIYTIVIPVLK